MQRKHELFDDYYNNDAIVLSEKEFAEIAWKEVFIALLNKTPLPHPYTIKEGTSVETLEEMKKKYRNLELSINDAYKQFFIELAFHAFQYKNKPVFKWLLMEIPMTDMFELSHEIWSLEENYWIAGLELMAKCIVQRKDSPSLDQLYQLPALLAILKEKNYFPFAMDPCYDSSRIINLLAGKWEHPISKLEWCKKNIPNFIEILKKWFSKRHTDTVECMVSGANFDKDFFIELISEFPEFLDLKETFSDGNTVLWSTLKVLWKDPWYSRLVFSFKKNPMVIGGISIAKPVESVDAASRALNNILSENYITQRLDLRGDYQTKMAKKYNERGEIPAYFCYIERNRLLFLLFLSMKDRSSLFFIHLNMELMSVIIKHLIVVTQFNQPSNTPYLNFRNSNLVKKFEESMNGANWSQLYSQKDFPFLYKTLTARWEHPLSVMEWGKGNIKGFTTILKKVDTYNNSTILHRMLRAPAFQSELFQNIIRELPELLDKTDRKGCSPIWLALRKQSHDPELIKFIFSQKKDPAEIAGIYLNTDQIKEGYDILNEFLAHNTRIQSLCFTESTKQRIAENLRYSEHHPRFFNYIARNKLQPFLLCMNDKNCAFLALNLDVMNIIIHNLIELISHDVKRSLIAQKMNFFKPLEKIYAGECQEGNERQKTLAIL